MTAETETTCSIQQETCGLRWNNRPNASARGEITGHVLLFQDSPQVRSGSVRVLSGSRVEALADAFLRCSGD